MSSRLRLWASVLLALCALVRQTASDYGPGSSSSSGSGPVNSDGVLAEVRSALTELCESAHRYVVSVVGKQTVERTVENAQLCLDSLPGHDKVQTVLECIQVAIRFLSEGAASGLNVIAVYVTEILRATGINVQLPFPHFTPEGVASVAQWALLALTGYWLLSLILRLAFLLIRRVLWLLKLCVALWLFVLIVSDTSASTDITAWRLACLVVACVLLGLGRVRTEGDRSSHLEGRLKSFEGRLREVERRRKRD
ncbi:transmembrane protein 109 isoform X1 [Scleropages formosus]|uniref:Si:dkey-74k8.3 n=1 Tax=Scleropages formosus TaxID=113540 RepID=A0A8C9QSW4_SCLFO|nr:transmembrane protein 109 isoform X1 [Scleropages formosus]